MVEGFALAIAGEVPPSLRNVRLLSLDVGALLAGASMKGEFESRLKALLEEAAHSPQPVILLLMKFTRWWALVVHPVRGCCQPAETGAGAWHPCAPSAQPRSEYKRHIEKDPALTRRFQVLQVAEPEEVAAVEMVRRLVTTLENTMTC